MRHAEALPRDYTPYATAAALFRHSHFVFFDDISRFLSFLRYSH
jgi:hypothetical protein